MVIRKNPDLASISARIQSLVQARRDSGLSSYYLSQLGNDLGNDLIRLEAATGKRLADFVQDEFDFKIASTGQYNTALYIYFGNTPTPPSKRLRIRKDLWEAFATPLRTGEKRHVNIATFEFGDRDAVSAAAGEVFELPASYVLGSGEQPIADALSDRIIRWLQENGLDPQAFAQVGNAKPVETLRPAKPAPADISENVEASGELLSAYQILQLCLTEDQLRRVTIPIDALDALTKQKFRR